MQAQKAVGQDAAFEEGAELVLDELRQVGASCGLSLPRGAAPGGTAWSARGSDGLKPSGSGANGGDLDFAKADSYVPEFGQAMSKLKKGEMTELPVKTQFGFHIIHLDDNREASFPAFDDVKGQIKQRLEQVKMQDFQDQLRSKAKTDYKFGAN